MIFIIPLLIEFILGFLARSQLRNVRWAAWGFVIVPLSVAFITSGPANLFSDGGEAHNWTIMFFWGLALFGIAANTMGVVIGQLLRETRTLSLRRRRHHHLRAAASAHDTTGKIEDCSMNCNR
jgi:hypothetical protein